MDYKEEKSLMAEIMKVLSKSLQKGNKLSKHNKNETSSNKLRN